MTAAGQESDINSVRSYTVLGARKSKAVCKCLMLSSEQWPIHSCQMPEARRGQQGQGEVSNGATCY